LKRKMFLVHKWSIMKIKVIKRSIINLKRKEFHEHYKGVFEHRAKAKEWVTLMILCRHIASFRDNFVE
jgi:hypothetical protein